MHETYSKQEIIKYLTEKINDLQEEIVELNSLDIEELKNRNLRSIAIKEELLQRYQAELLKINAKNGSYTRKGDKESRKDQKIEELNYKIDKKKENADKINGKNRISRTTKAALNKRIARLEKKKGKIEKRQLKMAKAKFFYKSIGIQAKSIILGNKVGTERISKKYEEKAKKNEIKANAALNNEKNLKAIYHFTSMVINNNRENIANKCAELLDKKNAFLIGAKKLASEKIKKIADEIKKNTKGHTK